MNLTVRFPNPDGEMKEKHIVMNQNCTLFKTRYGMQYVILRDAVRNMPKCSRFSKDEFVFGTHDENTTFYVHVYDFEPPLWIIISFSQHPKLDLLQFFITFST